MGTVRGRIGYAFDQVLIYGTGGHAWADNRVTASLLGLSASDSKVHSGWTLGAGVEVMFAPKWSVKAEHHLYRSFEGQTYFAGIAPLPSGTLNLNSVQVGVNYRFQDFLLKLPAPPFREPERRRLFLSCSNRSC